MAFDGNRPPELEKPQTASSSLSGGGGVEFSGIIDKIVGDIFSKFRRFLAGLEVNKGLKVNDGLTATGWTSLKGGAEIHDGLGADTVAISKYLVIGNEFKVGSFRFYLDSTTPLPTLVMEQLTAVGVWTWVTDFKLFSG